MGGGDGGVRGVRNGDGDGEWVWEGNGYGRGMGMGEEYGIREGGECMVEIQWLI